MLKKFWRKIWGSLFVRSWFVASAAYASASVCPCCGKPGCPVGLGAAVAVGGALVSFVAAVVVFCKGILIKKK